MRAFGIAAVVLCAWATLAKAEAATPQGPIDIILVIDTTDSMQSSIDSMRKNARAEIGRLREHTKDIRLAVTTFRDLADDKDRSHFLVKPFSRDLESAFAALDGLRAESGGDTPEDQLHGISLGLALWEKEGKTPDRIPTKIIIVVTDAPAHSPDSMGNTFASIAKRAFDVDSAHIYPVIVGDDLNALRDADQLATETGGAIVRAATGEQVANAVRSAVDDAATSYAPVPVASPRMSPLTIGGVVASAAGVLLLIIGLSRRRPRLAVVGALIGIPGVVGIAIAARSRAPAETDVTAPHVAAQEWKPPVATPPRGLLAHVPAEAFTVVGVDLGKARGSAAAMAAVKLLLRRTGLESRAEEVARNAGFDLYAAGTSLVIAGVPGASGAAPVPLVILGGTFDASKIATSSELAVANNEILLAPAAVLAKALAANDAITTGGLAEALRTVDEGALAFGAVRMIDRAKAGLAQILPDLGSIRWMAGTLEVSAAGITIAGSAVCPDQFVAARLAVTIGMGRKVAASQMPSAAVAAAVGKIAFTAMGASIRITATWSTADLEALLAIL